MSSLSLAEKKTSVGLIYQEAVVRKLVIPILDKWGLINLNEYRSYKYVKAKDHKVHEAQADGLFYLPQGQNEFEVETFCQAIQTKFQEIFGWTWGELKDKSKFKIYNGKKAIIRKGDLLFIEIKINCEALSDLYNYSILFKKTDVIFAGLEERWNLFNSANLSKVVHFLFIGDGDIMSLDYFILGYEIKAKNQECQALWKAKEEDAKKLGKQPVKNGFLIYLDGIMWVASYDLCKSIAGEWFDDPIKTKDMHEEEIKKIKQLHDDENKKIKQLHDDENKKSNQMHDDQMKKVKEEFALRENKIKEELQTKFREFEEFVFQNSNMRKDENAQKKFEEIKEVLKRKGDSKIFQFEETLPKIQKT